MRLISAASARICGLAKPPNTARGAATAFGSKAQQLNILFLTNAHNGLSQRAKGVLEAQGHSVNVELALTQSQIKDVTADANPDVIICPFLTARVPEEIWRKGYPKPDVPVVIVHHTITTVAISTAAAPAIIVTSTLAVTPTITQLVIAQSISTFSYCSLEFVFGVIVQSKLLDDRFYLTRSNEPSCKRGGRR